MSVQATTGKPYEMYPFAIALRRDQRGRTELAHELGVDPVTVWRWQTGRKQPASNANRRIAASVLGRSVEQLFPSEQFAEAA